MANNSELAQTLRASLAVILEKIADAPTLDDHLYDDFERTLKEVQVDWLVGAAADELTEYYLTSRQKVLLGHVNPEFAEKERESHKQALKLYARAIRANITRSADLEKLRKQQAKD